MPLLSIIIPVYNTPAELLTQCVESVLRQSFAGFEIILVDDGSCEEIAILIDDIAMQDRRIKVFHQQNRGVSSARNLGIQKSLGTYLMFIDSDDVLASQALIEGISAIENHNADIIIGLTKSVTREVWERTKKIESKESLEIEIINDPDSYYKLISQILTIDSYWFQYQDGYLSSGPVAKLYHHDLIKQTWFNEQIKVGEDTIWLLEILAKSNKVCIVNKLWYYYISNADSATHKFRPDRIEEFFCEIEEYNFVVNTFWPQNLPDFYIRLYIPLKSVFEQYLFHPQYRGTLKNRYYEYKMLFDTPVMNNMIRTVDFTLHKKSIKNVIKQISLKTALFSKALSFGINAILFTAIR